MNAKTYVDLCHGHKYYHNQRFPMKHKSFLKQNNNKPKFKSRSQLGLKIMKGTIFIYLFGDLVQESFHESFHITHHSRNFF
jgi:hypothetical protein